jgi:hypothetical protein
MADYRNDFKRIVEQSWSRQYKFSCTKAGWTELGAAVEVEIDPTVQRTASHYWIQVAKVPADEGFRAMVCHAPDWNGQFCNRDIEPEQAKKRDQAFGLFAMNWLNKAIIDTGCDFLPFDAGSKALTTAANASLSNFADKARRYLTKEAMDAGMMIWVYAKTGAKDHFVTAGGRSKAIADRLKTLLSPYDSAVQVVSKFSAQPWMEKPLKENLARRCATLSDKDKKARNFQGGMLFVKSFLDNSEKFNTTDMPSLPRNYIVVAHEFGHILGLPDEYMGVQCLRMKNVIDLRADLPPLTSFKKTADRQEAQQEGFAKLIQKSVQPTGKPSMPAPFMGSGASIVTDSIMFAGNRILPVHYITLWRALGKCTKPDIDTQEWQIEADNPRNAIHTLLGI